MGTLISIIKYIFQISCIIEVLGCTVVCLLTFIVMASSVSTTQQMLLWGQSRQHFYYTGPLLTC